MSIESILFLIFALIGIVSAVLVISMANPMKSALFLILNFIALSGIYLTLHAQFVAIMQIVVYAGAIMVLVLFVIMLLNLQDDARLRETRGMKQYLGFAFAAGLFGVIAHTVTSVVSLRFGAMSPDSEAVGTVESIGRTLYSSFLLPIELTSLLLTLAVIGALVLAKKRFP